MKNTLTVSLIVGILSLTAIVMARNIFQSGDSSPVVTANAVPVAQDVVPTVVTDPSTNTGDPSANVASSGLDVSVRTLSDQVTLLWNRVPADAYAVHRNGAYYATTVNEYFSDGAVFATDLPYTYQVFAEKNGVVTQSSSVQTVTEL